MTDAQKVLVADSVRFYSPSDEYLFFAWIGKIPCISKCEGKGCEILLTVECDLIEDESLREILALFFRYEIDMSQLEDLAADKKMDWFLNKNSYWYKAVFEK